MKYFWLLLVLTILLSTLAALGFITWLTAIVPLAIVVLLAVIGSFVYPYLKKDDQ